MTLSTEEQKLARASRKRVSPRGFGGSQAPAESSPSPSMPEPSESAAHAPTADASSEQFQAGLGSTDLLNPQYWLQQGVQAGRQIAPLYIAGVAQGLTFELLLHPGQVWQQATALMPSQPELSLEQQQQQRAGWLQEAIQAEFTEEELGRLPESMAWMRPVPALAAEAEAPALETTAAVVESEPAESASEPTASGSESAEVQAETTEAEPSEPTEAEPTEAVVEGGQSDAN